MVWLQSHIQQDQKTDQKRSLQGLGKQLHKNAEKSREFRSFATVEDDNSTTGNSNTTQNATVTIVEEDPDPQNLLFGDSDYVDEGNHIALEKREHLIIAFMVGLFGLIVLIIIFRRLTEKSLSEILVSRLNSVMKDVIIIITVLTVILYFEFIDAFDWSLNINGIGLAFLAYALSWLSISTVVLLIMQVYCSTWEKHEAVLPQKGILLIENFKSNTSISKRS